MFIDTNLLDDGFTIIWALHKCPIEKVLSRIEKELEWESNNVAIKTKLIKQQNQKSWCLLLTLKQKDKAILQKIQALASWWRAAATMEGKVQTRASVLGMKERRKERTAAAFLCCRLIIVGSWIEPTVIEPNHCRFVAWTGSVLVGTHHCRFKPRADSDWALSLSVLAKNRRW